MDYPLYFKADVRVLDFPRSSQRSQASRRRTSRLHSMANSTSKQPVDDNSLKTVYAETADIAHVFWEWRHKVITIFFAAIGTVGIVAGWILNHPQLRGLVIIPFLIGALLSAVIAALDRANTRILTMCYLTNFKIEKRWHINEGIYGTLYLGVGKRGSYAYILRRVYLFTSIVFAIAGAVLFVLRERL